MTIAVAPLASAAEQNSAYARNKEGRFGKPGRPSLCLPTIRHPELVEGSVLPPLDPQLYVFDGITELPNFPNERNFLRKKKGKAASCDPKGNVAEPATAIF